MLQMQYVDEPKLMSLFNLVIVSLRTQLLAEIVRDMKERQTFSNNREFTLQYNINGYEQQHIN